MRKTATNLFWEFPDFQRSLNKGGWGISCFNGTASRIVFNKILHEKLSRGDKILYLYSGKNDLSSLVEQSNVTLKEITGPEEVRLIEFSDYEAAFIDCFDLLERNIDNLDFCEDLVRALKTSGFETPRFFVGDEQGKFSYLITIQDNMCDLIVTANIAKKGFYETYRRQPIVLYIEKDRFLGNNNIYGVYTSCHNPDAEGCAAYF